MYKSNLITLLSFFLIAVLVLCSLPFEQPSGKDDMIDIGTPLTQTVTRLSESSRRSPHTADVSFAHTLFIGDSRTVGLMEYAGLEEADFFCTVGMSLFSVEEVFVEVDGVGAVTLETLLAGRAYDRIYIMLGINDLGYDEQSIVDQYRHLVQTIRRQAPDAQLYLQANLHVTRERSQQDATFNNAAIDRLNASLEEMANTQNLIYLDANVLFDDGGGNLSEEKSADQTHLYAKYYAQWGTWIMEQTALRNGEGSA